MFEYSDPTAGTLLASSGALEIFRRRVHEEYQRCATKRNSAFAELSAFDGIVSAALDDVVWPAFPKNHGGASGTEIDQARLTRQDEYAEWRTSVSGGSISEITFTTDFAEYFAALAAAGSGALTAGIREIYPEAKPTVRELFGAGPNPDRQSPDERWDRFVRHAPRNPWNSGEKGILFLAHPSNNMSSNLSTTALRRSPAPILPPYAPR